MDAPARRSPRSPRGVGLHVEAGPAGARPSETAGATSPRAGATSPRASAAPAALPDLGFRGRTVMVTGAGGQFGRSGGVYFARCGANVVLLDLAPAALAEAQAEVQAAHRAAGLGSASCLALQCDITDAAAVHCAVTDACRAFPAGIDCLWNNAGYQGEMRPIHEYQARDFEKVMSVNVVGSFNVLQAVAQAMIARGRGGSIVNTASVAALRGTPTMCAYVASKAALIGLTTCAAKDLAPYKIRVNAISPALIGPGYMWDRQNQLHATSGSPYYDRDPERVAAGKVGQVPLKRLGTVDEVVQSVAFLLSDCSSYTTAHNLVVSGGLA